MCDMYIPQNAYQEQHISCAQCKKEYASTFMVSSWIPSNYEQAVSLGKMKIKNSETYEDIDAKGNKQLLTRVIQENIPWFAQNPSKAPLLMPLCSICKSNQDNDKQYINCHYGFILFKMQKSRFKSGSPYLPWISDQLKEIMANSNI